MITLPKLLINHLGMKVLEDLTKIMTHYLLQLLFSLHVPFLFGQLALLGPKSLILAYVDVGRLRENNLQVCSAALRPDVFKDSRMLLELFVPGYLVLTKRDAESISAL